MNNDIPEKTIAQATDSKEPISFGLNYDAYTRGFEPPKKQGFAKAISRRLRKFFKLSF